MLDPPSTKAVAEEAAASPEEQRLRALIEALRDDPAALAARLAREVPSFRRGPCQLLLSRLLGPRRGGEVARQAFAGPVPALGLPPSSVSLAEATAAASQPGELAEALLQLLRRPEIDGAAVRERLATLSPTLLAGAFSLLRQSGLGDPAGENALGALATALGGLDGLGGPRLPPAIELQLRRTFGPRVQELAIELGSTRPAWAQGVTVDGRIHLGGDASDLTSAASRRTLGHEVAHVLQQRHGGGTTLSATARGELEGEADRAGDAFVRGEPFEVRGQAPRSVALFADNWTNFRNAARARDRAALETALRSLSRAERERTRTPAERPVMIDFLRTLGDRRGPELLHRPLRFNIEQGLELTVAAAAADTTLVGGVAAWIQRADAQFSNAMRLLSRIAGVTRAMLGPVFALPRATAREQSRAARNNDVAAWVRTLYQPALPTVAFQRLDGTQLLRCFREGTAFRDWILAAPERLEGELVRLGVRRRDAWIAAFLEHHQESALRFVVTLGGAPWGEGLERLVRRGTASQRRAIRQDPLLLGAAVRTVGPRAVTFLDRLDVPLVDGGLALVFAGRPTAEFVRFANLRRFDAAAQQTAAKDRRFPLLWLVYGQQYVTTVLTRLAADPTRLAATYRDSPWFATWLRSDRLKFKADVVAKSGAQLKTYVKGLLQNNDGKYILEQTVAEAPRWQQAVIDAGAFNDVMDAPPRHGDIPKDSPLDVGFWKLYEVAPDLTGRKKAFSKLWRAPITDSGTPTFTSPNPLIVKNFFNRPAAAGGASARENTQTKVEIYKGSYQTQYPTMAPSTKQFDVFVGQLKLMPRAHVNTVSQIVFSGNSAGQSKTTVTLNQKEKSPGVFVAMTPPWSTNWQDNITTSFYVSAYDAVVMNVDKFVNLSGGAMDYGENVATGVDNSSGQTVPWMAGGDANNKAALSFFQNHATHEMGHSVGAKPFRYKDAAGALQKSVSGDAFIKSWSGWTPVGRTGILSSYWSAGAASKASGATAPAGAKDWVAPGDASKFLLDALAVGGPGNVPFPPPRLGTALAPAWTAAAAWNAIKTQYAGEHLVKYVSATVGIGNTAYQLGNFTPPGDPLYIYSASDGDFVSFKKAVWNDRSKLSWYGMSHFREMFAEMYTNRFGGQGRDTPTGTKDFFDKLEKAEDFGAVEYKNEFNWTTTVTVTAGANFGPAVKQAVVADKRKWIRPWP